MLAVFVFVMVMEVRLLLRVVAVETERAVVQGLCRLARAYFACPFVHCHVSSAAAAAAGCRWLLQHPQLRHIPNADSFRRPIANDLAL